MPLLDWIATRRRQRRQLLDELGAPHLLQALTEAERLQVTATQIKTVFAMGNGAALTLLAPPLMCVVALRDAPSVVYVVQVIVWSALMTLCCCALLLLIARFQATPRAIDETLHAGRRMGWIAVALGASIGASVWVFPQGPDSALIAPLVAAAAMLLATASGLSIYRPLILRFVLPLTLVFSSGLVFLGGALNWVFATGVALMAYAILDYAMAQNAATTAAFGLRLQAEKLLAQVVAQQQATDVALAEARVSREAAEAADRGKSSFLAAASHDLRQPMHALVQYTGHLARNNRDPALDQTVQRIGQAMDSMQDLLDSILDVSKLMMGAVQADVRSFSIGRLLERLDAQLRPLADAKGLALRVDVVAATVQTDEVLLERILRNLLLNALRYTDAGRVRLRCKPMGAQLLRLQVWDSGIGIDRSQHQQIFQAFYQVGNPARDSRKGLGLGLSLVQQMCVLLGLPLGLRSRPGRGSVFWVDVPLASAAATEQRHPQPEASDYARGAVVVLIDDNDASLQASAATLRLFGCRVLCAESGPQALQLLQQQLLAPDLVISDHRLAHGETGIDAIQLLREQQRSLHGDDFEVGALIVSGDTAPTEIGRVQAAGLQMLHKPLKVDAFYAAVNAELARLAQVAT